VEFIKAYLNYQYAVVYCTYIHNYTYRICNYTYISGYMLIFLNMPSRRLPLVNNEIYHIFNRGITFQPVFIDKRDYRRGIGLMKFYSVLNPSVRYSQFMLLSQNNQMMLLEENKGKDRLVDILAYCLMPNHFHFLLKQNMENGIEEFVRKFEISYTRYFNVKRNRRGPLLQGQFKNVLIENDSQIMQVSRYIHLNPYTSHLINDYTLLQRYDWSSFKDYITSSKSVLTSTDLISSLFIGKNVYREFVLDHADYQRRLGDIKHLIFE